MTSVVCQRWTQTIHLSCALKGTTFKRFLVRGPAELWMVKRQSESKDSPYIPLMGEHAVHFRTADTGNGTLNPLQAHLNAKGISHKAANKHTPRIKSTVSCTKPVWYSEHGTYCGFEIILEGGMSATHVAVIPCTRTHSDEEGFLKK